MHKTTSAVNAVREKSACRSFFPAPPEGIVTVRSMREDVRGDTAMGTWGRGILQNDTSQDGLCNVIHGISGDLVALGKKRATKKSVGRVGAGFGLLLQLSAHYWFQEDGHWPKLRPVLESHQKLFATLSPEAVRLLEAVLAGEGATLVARDAPPDARLGRALFATDSQGFSMERTFSVREPALFEHPEAVRYVQEVADRLVAELDEGFADDSVVDDLCREADFMGSLAVLLVIEPCHVDPDHFGSWRARFRAAQGDYGDEADFFTAYNENLELAFQIGLEKFAQT
jgi:hypothetical protein